MLIVSSWFLNLNINQDSHHVIHAAVSPAVGVWWISAGTMPTPPLFYTHASHTNLTHINLLLSQPPLFPPVPFTRVEKSLHPNSIKAHKHKTEGKMREREHNTRVVRQTEKVILIAPALLLPGFIMGRKDCCKSQVFQLPAPLWFLLLKIMCATR